MAAKLAYNIFLLYLLIAMLTQGSREAAREMGSNNEDMNKHVHAMTHSQFHMDHMDPKLMVFLFIHDLKVGNKLPIYFPNKDPSKSPHLLPRQEANSIPFSYQQLPYLLNFFSFAPGSVQAKAMEDTLKQCTVIKPIEGETKFCATSLESMLDFVHGVLEAPMKIVTTTHFTKQKASLQNYTIIEEAREIPAPKMVACHTMPYPYTVFYCHSQESVNRVFLVSLVGDDGSSVQALAVCHMDTSQWRPDHVSFRVLGIEAGSSHVCHFFPDDNPVFVPLPPAMSS